MSFPYCPHTTAIGLGMEKTMDATAHTAFSTAPKGYSPAQLAAMDAIRWYGIREARKIHADLFKLVERFKESPALFSAAIHPASTTDEAITDAKRFLALYNRMPRRDRGPAVSFKVRKAHETIILARYFRRFGERVWARRAA